MMHLTMWGASVDVERISTSATAHVFIIGLHSTSSTMSPFSLRVARLGEDEQDHFSRAVTGSERLALLLPVVEVQGTRWGGRGRWPPSCQAGRHASSYSLSGCICPFRTTRPRPRACSASCTCARRSLGSCQTQLFPLVLSQLRLRPAGVKITLVAFFFPLLLQSNASLAL